MPIELKNLDSARFGIICAQIRDEGASLAEIDAAAAEMRVAMMMARVDSRNVTRLHELESGGFRLMDTLVYYSCLLGDENPVSEDGGSLIARLATPRDSAAVQNIAREAFQDYVGHYHSDSRLSRREAAEVYVDWARRSIEEPSPGEFALVACIPDLPVGFMTVRKRSVESAEIVLNGVAPGHQGQGVNSFLIRHMKAHVRAAGQRSAIVSTHLTNVIAQRVWIRMGFSPERSVHTFHKWYLP